MNKFSSFLLFKKMVVFPIQLIFFYKIIHKNLNITTLLQLQKKNYAKIIIMTNIISSGDIVLLAPIKYISMSEWQWIKKCKRLLLELIPLERRL